jgi:hypothetical protein
LDDRGIAGGGAVAPRRGHRTPVEPRPWLVLAERFRRDEPHTTSYSSSIRSRATQARASADRALLLGSAREQQPVGQLVVLTSGLARRVGRRAMEPLTS